MKLRNKKTGDIGELTGVKRIVVYALDSNKVLGEYDSLARLNAEWEDYEPKEPLIKDEKIRKAVRAWAEANKSSKAMTNGFNEITDEKGLDIDVSEVGAFINLENGKWYAIAELCGEEKCES